MYKTETDSMYSKSFYVFESNGVKKDAVWQTGAMNREVFNRVSAYVFNKLNYNKNPEDDKKPEDKDKIIKTDCILNEITTYQNFIKHIRTISKEPEYEHLFIETAALQASIYRDVYISYVNKLKAIKQDMHFYSLVPGYDDSGKLIEYKKAKPTDILMLANDMKFYVMQPFKEYHDYYDNIETRINKAGKKLNNKKNSPEENVRILENIQYYYKLRELADRIGDKVWNIVYIKVMHKMTKTPVFFRSRNFETASRSKRVLNPNKNKRSKIAAFTTVTLPTRNRLSVPLKCHKGYHGGFEHYNTGIEIIDGKEVVKNNYYTMMFVFDYNDTLPENDKWLYVNKERVHRYKQSLNMPAVYKAVDKDFEDCHKNWKYKDFHIVLPYKNDRQLAVVDDSTPLLGIDCNTSRMLLAASDGSTYGNEKLERMKYYVSRLIYFTKKYKNAKNMNSRSRYLKSKKKLERKIDGLRHELIAELIQDHTSYKKNKEYKDGVRIQPDAEPDLHLVLEELVNSFGETYSEQVLDKKRPNKKYNTNDVSRGLKLSSIKDEMKSIGNTYNVGTSFVPSEYTSRICPVCGCHLKKNRSSQDKFKCDHYGYTADADINAAQNIKEFKNSDVLGSRLLALDGTGCGTYKTKPSLSHWQIKNIVSEFCNEKMREFDLQQMNNDLQTNRGNFV